MSPIRRSQLLQGLEAHETDVKEPSPELLADKVGCRVGWARKGLAGAGNRRRGRRAHDRTGLSALVQAVDSNDGHTLPEIYSTTPDVVDVARTEAQEITGGSVIDGVAPVEIPGPSSLNGDIMALLNQRHRVRILPLFCLCPQMQFGTPREGSHQSPDHGRQQGQESLVGDIFSSCESCSKGGFMRDRDQWMDKREEVVHKALQCR